MVRNILFWVFILGISLQLNAQYFQTGEDPASLKWRQINTSNFQVIYPEGFEANAQRLAHSLEEVYKYGSQTLKHKPKKISVLLHTHTIYSNGLVALAPHRMELYTTPHQSNYPQDWLEQLAIHEFRHVVQVDKIEESMPGIARLLLGQQATALAVGAYLPFWFLEGDAVVAETALSNFGRGRLPSFLMEHKAQVVEKGVYSFSKAYNGSYKDFVPNHYKLGYYMVAASRHKFGRNIWEPVASNVGKKPFSFTPFKGSLKKEIGVSPKQLYELVFDSLKSAWLADDLHYKLKEFTRVTPKPKTFTNYQFNFYHPSGKIITQKSSSDEITRFVALGKDGKEKRVHTPGNIYNESVSFTNGVLVWSEKVPDERWAHSGNSVVHFLNLENDCKKEFKPEYKGVSPVLSEDKDRVVMVEADYQNNFYLSVYNINSGKLLARFQTRGNNYFFTPKWLDANSLVVIMLTPKGKKLVHVNPFTKELQDLTDENFRELKHPVVSGNTVYFISSYSGKNSLYALNLDTKKVAQVYEPRFGVEYPAISPGKSKILLSNYTADGFGLIEIPLDQNSWKPITEIKKGKYPLAESMKKQEPGVIDFQALDTTSYKSSPYSKLANIINIHSWAPLAIDINSYDIQPGVSIMSQNVLGTGQASVGYKWDTDNKEGRWYANYIYKGWYPQFEFEASTGKRESQYYLVRQTLNNEGEVIKRDTTLEGYDWQETRLEADIKLPLNFTKGKFFRLLQPELKYELTSIKQGNSSPENFFNGNLQTLAYRVYYHQILRQSPQDVLPDFGIILDATYRHSPFGDLDAGSISAFQAISYLPGALPNHGVRLYYGYQDRGDGPHNLFSDAIRYPRGWGKSSNDNMYTFSADYRLPLAYPDLSIGGIMYLKRLRASIFADFARQEGVIYENNTPVAVFSRNLSSYGVELVGDMNWFRFYAPVQLGFRASYLRELEAMDYAVLLSINFTSF